MHWQLFVPSTVQMQQLFLQHLVHLRKSCKQLLRPLDSALVWAPRKLIDCTRFCINHSLENRLWKARQSPCPSVEEASLSFGCCSQQSKSCTLADKRDYSIYGPQQRWDSCPFGGPKERNQRTAVISNIYCSLLEMFVSLSCRKPRGLT